MTSRGTPYNFDLASRTHGLAAITPVDPNLPVPLYRQVSDQLAKLALYMRPGERLPSEFDIIAKFGVSRGTAIQALGVLERQGIADRRQGRGTFIAKPDCAVRSNRSSRLPSFSEDLRSSGRTTREHVISIDRWEAHGEVAESLQMSPLEEVWRIERVILSDDDPVVHAVSWLPCALFESLTVSLIETSSLYEQLWSRSGMEIRPSVADEQWNATAAPSTTARLLNLEKRTPVLRVVRIACWDDMKPAEFSVSFVRGDAFVVAIHIDSRRDGRRALSDVDMTEKPL